MTTIYTFRSIRAAVEMMTRCSRLNYGKRKCFSVAEHTYGDKGERWFSLDFSEAAFVAERSHEYGRDETGRALLAKDAKAAVSVLAGFCRGFASAKRPQKASSYQETVQAIAIARKQRASLIPFDAAVLGDDEDDEEAGAEEDKDAPLCVDPFAFVAPEARADYARLKGIPLPAEEKTEAAPESYW